MTLRDELSSELDHCTDILAGRECDDAADALLPWLESKLREARAETVEQCTDFIERRYQSGICGNDVEEMRSLSPIPNYRQHIETEILEQCYPLICALCAEPNPVEWQESKKRWVHKDSGCTVQCGASGLRSLSPDPGFLERERLKARLEEARQGFHDYSAVPHKEFYPLGRCTQCQRIAELERQLAELDKEVKHGAPQ